ncbi:MAG: efflux RND transporter periplasmic adaptor subunit [Candidatus Anammoxibacter sp.]
MPKTRLIWSIAIPVIIISFAVLTAKLVINSRPDVKRRQPPKQVITVEVMSLKKSDFQVWLKSSGTVRPRTQSILIPEVSGRIINVSPKFREGSFFEKGDILLEIDPKDYETAIVIANSELLEAKSNLELEKAESEIAIKDWESNDMGITPRALALRKPQLHSAQSRLKAAESQLEQKKINLIHTRISAPYAGRIRNQHADIGQYVSPGTVLADIYAVDYAEIRLPLTDHQMAFVDLPELYRGETEDKAGKGPVVKFTIRQGNRNYVREGRVVRTEGAVDPLSRQLFVVAHINNPYGRLDNKTPPLKIGQFIEAEIKGNLLRDVFVIPSSSLRGSDSVLIVDESNHISSRKVNVVWSTRDQVVIDSGLSQGERLSLTPLRYVVSNNAIKVQVKGEQPSGKNEDAGKPYSKKTGSVD